MEKIGLIIFSMLFWSHSLLAEFSVSSIPSQMGQTTGVINVSYNGNQGPFEFQLKASCDTSVIISSKSPNDSKGSFEFDQLAAGAYVVVLMDKNSCETCRSVVVDESDCFLEVIMTGKAHVSTCDFCDDENVVSCANDGYIGIRINSSIEYSVEWLFPNGSKKYTESIRNLEVGKYTLTVSSATSDCEGIYEYYIDICGARTPDYRENGEVCVNRSYSESILLEKSDFTIIHPIGECNGKIIPPFDLISGDIHYNWTSSELLNNSIVDLENLCAGHYVLEINNGCSKNKIIEFTLIDCQTANLEYEIDVVSQEGCGSGQQRIIICAEDDFELSIFQDDTELFPSLWKYFDDGLYCQQYRIDAGDYNLEIYDVCNTVFRVDSINVPLPPCNELEIRNSQENWFVGNLVFKKDDSCNDDIFNGTGIDLEVNGFAGINCGYKIYWQGDTTQVNFIYKEGVGTVPRIEGPDHIDVEIIDNSSITPIKVELTNGCIYEFDISFGKIPIRSWYPATSSNGESLTSGYFGCVSCKVDGPICGASTQRCNENFTFSPFTYRPFDNADPCAGGYFYYMTGGGVEPIVEVIVPVNERGIQIGLETNWVLRDFFENSGCLSWSACQFSREAIPFDLIDFATSYPSCVVPPNYDILLLACSGYEDPVIDPIVDTIGNIIIDSVYLNDDCGPLVFTDAGMCNFDVTCTNPNGMLPDDGTLSRVSLPGFTCQIEISPGRCKEVLICSVDCSEMLVFEIDVPCNPALICNSVYPSICN